MQCRSHTERSKLNRLEYLKNHPIKYTSVFIPLFSFAGISLVAFLFITFDVSPEFFGGLLTEQLALKWIWIFASISISFLSIKFIISGPVNDYENKYVKSIGLNFANTALVISSSYVGIMWGALIPAYFLQGDLPPEFSFFNILIVCVIALLFVIVVYIFYLNLTANENAPEHYYNRVNSKTAKVLVGIFAVAFVNGRLLDIFRVFKPELF